MEKQVNPCNQLPHRWGKRWRADINSKRRKIKSEQQKVKNQGPHSLYVNEGWALLGVFEMISQNTIAESGQL